LRSADRKEPSDTFIGKKDAITHPRNISRFIASSVCDQVVVRLTVFYNGKCNALDKEF
jgi:hypothetical protein